MPAIEQIYDQLNQVLGGTNPNQFLSMTIPGTILDQATYAYDTTSRKPATVAEAESRLVDQMFDVAQVTDSSNGQHVSSQYLQALSVLVPTFDPMMPAVKNRLRAYLTSPAPPDAAIDGEPFTGNFGEYYFALYEAWLRQKSDWDKLVIANQSSMTPERFLEWYEGIAEGQLALIDAAEGRLLAVFSPSDMDAILGALAAGPGGEIEEAVTQVLDLRLPSPSGGFVYPVNLTPDNWFLDLASDADPANLLQDPQFIAVTIGARRQAIQASISQVQSLLSQVPTSGDLAAAAATLSSAATSYSQAQDALLNTYAANTVTAVEMYLAAETGGATDAIGQLDQDAAAVSKAAGDSPPAAGATKRDGSALTPDDLKKLLAGQSALISAQSGLITGAQGLANAGMNLASEQAQSFAGLPVFLARLQSQLSDLQALQGQIGAAVTASGQRSSAQVQTIETNPAVLQGAATVASAVPAAPTSAQDVLIALWTPIHSDATSTDLQRIYVSANAAWASSTADPVSVAANALATLASQVSEAAGTAAAQAGAAPADVLKAVKGLIPDSNPTPEQTALATLVAKATGTSAQIAAAAVAAEATRLSTVIQQAVQAAQTAVSAAQDGSFPAAIPTSSTPDPVMTAVTTACAKAPSVSTYLATVQAGLTSAGASASQQAALTAARSFVSPPTPTSAPALSSDRWMELQFSFTSDDMTSSNQQSSLSSQTSWSVDLFFGSAGGSSSAASSTVDNNSFEENTSIQIGLKATKVAIDRGWFDPGLFKLTSDMSRISSVVVAGGPVDPSNTDAIKKANQAILPCFPVAFLVAKDVTIQFQVSIAKLAAVQSVIDSRSAVGGGFLCFSASSSSAAHSDASSLSSHTEGTVITINMPGPQILGWFLEFTPQDYSLAMTDSVVQAGKDLNIIQFVDALKQVVPAGPSVGLPV